MSNLLNAILSVLVAVAAFIMGTASVQDSDPSHPPVEQPAEPDSPAK